MHDTRNSCSTSNGIFLEECVLAGLKFSVVRDPLQFLLRAIPRDAGAAAGLEVDAHRSVAPALGDLNMWATFFMREKTQFHKSESTQATARFTKVIGIMVGEWRYSIEHPPLQNRRQKV